MNRSASVFLLFALPLLAGCGARTMELDAEGELAGADAAVTDTGVVANDAGVVPSVDATPTVDDGPIVVADSGPAGKPIACGMTTCNSATQDCCFRGMDAPPSCTPKGTCGGAVLSCSSSSSCGAGQSCCFNQDEERSVCKSMCAPPREVTLCTNNAECPPRTRCRRAGGGLNACVPG